MSFVISTAELAQALADPALRLYDCTTMLGWDEQGKVKITTGRKGYQETGHIPGAALVELQQELSDATSPLRFTLPAPDALARAFGAKGIGDASRVVLYSAGDFWWASRIWWMLRSIGFDRAAILDGGMKKWVAEARPLTTEATQYAPATLTPRPRAGLFVGRNEVVAALDDPGAVVVNCLREEFHRGTAANHYGRPGRIPGSVNVPAGMMVREDGTFRSAAQIEQAFAERGVAPGKRVLAYCGGGIAATADAFALTALLGRDDVAVYDNSMQEWANDPTLPMIRD
jgi:thiosulfate/3-mercaptopyruvate sulfurtransferase